MYIPCPDYATSPIDVLPPPDYTGTEPDYNAPSHRAPLSLIPPPDYGIKAREMPVYNNYDEPMRHHTVYDIYAVPARLQAREAPPTEHRGHTVDEQHLRPATTVTQNGGYQPVQQHTVVEEEKKRNPVVETPPRDVPRHSYVPPVPPRDPFVAHSYLEDRDKMSAMQADNSSGKSMRSHIRSIGVPVLPPINSSAAADSGDFLGVSPHNNRAFRRHLENHRNFDTMKSLKSCDDCPLCQLMLGQAGEHQEHVQLENRGSKRGDVRDLFGQEESEEGEWKMTRRSYNERNEGEMSVGFREKVEVLQFEPTHALCRKTDGTLGWLPNFVILQ